MFCIIYSGVILIVTHYWKLHISLLILLRENTGFLTFRGRVDLYFAGCLEGRNKTQASAHDSGYWYYSKLTLMCWVTQFGSLWQNTWAASKEGREVTALEADEGLGGEGITEAGALAGDHMASQEAPDSEALVSLSKVCNNPFPWGANLRIWTGENCINSPT